MIDFAVLSDGVCWRNYASPGVLRPVALAKESSRGFTVGENIARGKNIRKRQCTISSNISMGPMPNTCLSITISSKVRWLEVTLVPKRWQSRNANTSVVRIHYTFGWP